MKEIYVKDVPKCCHDCKFYAITCCLAKQELIDLPIYQIKEGCPLRSLEAHDKQLRADTVREIIEKIEVIRGRMLDKFNITTAAILTELSDELSEQYKEKT